MAAPNEITIPQLARLIGTPECPVLIDTCLSDDFALDPRVIPTATRIPYLDVEAMERHIAGRRAVVYCKKGLKISQGSAARLRHIGVEAETLVGGQVAWAETGLPMVPWKTVPFTEQGHTLWVTRHRPKIDRIACPWLIRRFVDPKAEVLFVSPGQVLNVAEKFGATPFDVEEVFWTHRGATCTFETMLHEFGLETPELLRLGAIVRAADTDALETVPEAAGLLAASLGLSRMFRDDLAQVEAGMLLYDAFYRWARDAQEEGHSWPTNSK